MGSLSAQQIASLQGVLKACESAVSELADSCESGLMSDAKSSVYAVLTAVEGLSVPDELAKRLHQLADEAWNLTVSGGDDAYARAGAGLGGIGKLQSFLRNLLGAGA
jgi:hypothetical protein